jgi:hypothetical protein
MRDDCEMGLSRFKITTRFTQLDRLLYIFKFLSSQEKLLIGDLGYSMYQAESMVRMPTRGIDVFISHKYILDA